jgi:hypothetical protein
VTTPEPVDPGQVPTDLARVNRMLGRSEDDQEALEVVEAVLTLVPTWLDQPAAGWAAHHVLGATMLATRLERRKDSPGGLAQFGLEGAAYVAGNWADVAMLLGVGNYAVGRVG